MKLEPLKWVKASEYVEEGEPTPPQVIATEEEGELILLVGPNKRIWRRVPSGFRAPKGWRRGDCSKCHAILPNLEQRYCPKCASEAAKASKERHRGNV